MAGSHGDLKIALEEHWVNQDDSSTYAGERKLLGDLDVLDKPQLQVRLGRSDPAGALALLERIRAQSPDEPMWKGVDAMVETSKGVEVTFHESETIDLRLVDGVEVACVLYPRSGSPTTTSDDPPATGAAPAESI